MLNANSSDVPNGGEGTSLSPVFSGADGKLRQGLKAVNQRIIEEGPTVCKKCGKKLKTVQGLRLHERTCSGVDTRGISPMEAKARKAAISAAKITRDKIRSLRSSAGIDRLISAERLMNSHMMSMEMLVKRAPDVELKRFIDMKFNHHNASRRAVAVIEIERRKRL